MRRLPLWLRRVLEGGSLEEGGELRERGHFMNHSFSWPPAKGKRSCSLFFSFLLFLWIQVWRIWVLCCCNFLDSECYISPFSSSDTQIQTNNLLYPQTEKRRSPFTAKSGKFCLGAGAALSEMFFCIPRNFSLCVVLFICLCFLVGTIARNLKLNPTRSSVVRS